MPYASSFARAVSDIQSVVHAGVYVVRISTGSDAARHERPPNVASRSRASPDSPSTSASPSPRRPCRRARRRARSRARRRSAPEPRDPSPRRGSRAARRCDECGARITIWLPDATARGSAFPTEDVRDVRCGALRGRLSACTPRAGVVEPARRAGSPRSARCHAARERFGIRRPAPACSAARSAGVGDEQLARVAPQIVERRLRARVALSGAVAERDHPLRRVAHVIARLLDRLGGDAGERRRRATAESASIWSNENDAEQQLPHDRDSEVASRQLDQQHVPEVGRVAQVREVVLARGPCPPPRRRA